METNNLDNSVYDACMMNKILCYDENKLLCYDESNKKFYRYSHQYGVPAEMIIELNKVNTISNEQRISVFSMLYNSNIHPLLNPISDIVNDEITVNTIFQKYTNSKVRSKVILPVKIENDTITFKIQTYQNNNYILSDYELDIDLPNIDINVYEIMHEYNGQNMLLLPQNTIDIYDVLIENNYDIFGLIKSGKAHDIKRYVYKSQTMI